MEGTDLITQMQDQLSALCSMLFNFTGAVQVKADCCQAILYLLFYLDYVPSDFQMLHFLKPFHPHVFRGMPRL